MQSSQRSAPEASGRPMCHQLARRTAGLAGQQSALALASAQRGADVLDPAHAAVPCRLPRQPSTACALNTVTASSLAAWDLSNTWQTIRRAVALAHRRRLQRLQQVGTHAPAVGSGHTGADTGSQHDCGVGHSGLTGSKRWSLPGSACCDRQRQQRHLTCTP